MRGFGGNERGIALALALVSVMVVGALVAGALFLGTQEQRVGGNQTRFVQSLGIAEAGPAELVRQWSPDSFNALRVFPADTYALGSRATAGNTGTYAGSVWKLNRNLYMLDVEGLDVQSGSGGLTLRGAGARQHLGMLARIRLLEVPTAAVITTQNATSISGNVVIDGTDHIPNPSWTSCAPLDSAKAGLNIDGTISTTGSNFTVIGNPPVRQDTSINNGTFNMFGDVTYAQLTSRAQKVFAGGFSSKPQSSVAGGVCNKADPLNWGDGLNHAGVCANYFPIVHVTGDASINNYQGQGVLLIDGDLTVSGNFEYFGVVIVQGALFTSGGGSSPAHFYGTVLVKNDGGATNSFGGGAKALYSKCAILQALEGTGTGAMLRSRGWVALN